ncbi:MAG: hypothetical protein P8L23_05180 [Flavobacteriales bacterium]|nr:hypothetical protein [Flavobacteriales bacterium]
MENKEPFRYFLVVFIYLLSPSVIFGQSSNLNQYIPFDNTHLSTHPELIIKTWVHIIQKENDNPENLTEDSLEFIKNQFNWINQMYKKLKKPSLNAMDGSFPYVPESRIKFMVDTITFHVDEDGWDRMKMAPVTSPRRLIKILSVNQDSNFILIEGQRQGFKLLHDSIIVSETCCNNGIFKTKKIERRGSNTIIYVKEKLNQNEINVGSLSYFQKIDKNCHKDNWLKFTGENKDYLHVFYTGASVNAKTFGCGPSPYFLNVSKILKNGGYATAQLTAHELGHCLGLRHTNSPQFDDLPKSDKFGWIKCNSINTSNNIMGYNLCRNYLSPKQIGFIHSRYSNVIELTKTTKNNVLDNKKDIYVSDDEQWVKSTLISGDIIIRKGVTLEINDIISLADESRIYLEKNAVLKVNGGLIRNINSRWNGLVFCKSALKPLRKPIFKKNTGEVILENDGKIIY